MQRGRPCSSTWRVALAFLLGVAAVNGLCGENQRVGRDPYSYNNFVCEDCPVNTVRVAGDDPDAGYETYCTCPAGYLISAYWGSSYTPGCGPCPANSTSTAQEMRGYQTSCYCKENFHADFGKLGYEYRGTCEPCPAGLTNAAGDAVCYRDMNYCEGYDGYPETTYCDAGPPCAEDEYVTSSYTCAACPEHSTNPAGDNPGAGATSCKCKRNYHVSGNVCVPCGAGYKRPAGDSVPGADTVCEVAVPCAENEYVVDTACRPCPTGSVKPAGDDPAGDDTFCNCTENKHVHNNACVDCSTYIPDANSNYGAVRAAGDQVPGPDTLCSCQENMYPFKAGYNKECRPCPGNSTSDGGQVGPNIFNSYGAYPNGPFTCRCKEHFRVQNEQVSEYPGDLYAWKTQCVPCESGLQNSAGDEVGFLSARYTGYSGYS